MIDKKLEKSIERRWTLYICEECTACGWEFERPGDCEYGTGRHHGKHGGPVEVMPVEDHLQALGEAEKERVAQLETRDRWLREALAERDDFGRTMDLAVERERAAEQSLQTLRLGLEAEVERWCHAGGTPESRREGREYADRLKALLDQAETAGEDRWLVEGLSHPPLRDAQTVRARLRPDETAGAE